MGSVLWVLTSTPVTSLIWWNGTGWWLPSKKWQGALQQSSFHRKNTVILPYCLDFQLEDYTFPSTFAAAAKLLQSCLTLCDPIDSSPLGSSVPRILQARTLEWVAISFSNAWKWKVKMKSLSHVWLFATPWTAAYQAPPSMGFSRQEYWSGVPLPLGGYKSFVTGFFIYFFLLW